MSVEQQVGLCVGLRDDLNAELQGELHGKQHGKQHAKQHARLRTEPQIELQIDLEIEPSNELNIEPARRKNDAFLNSQWAICPLPYQFSRLLLSKSI
ncbi:hypothetical protein ACUNV4_12040 [Granulosicoccus sp. 3-233]|uniref:hypothetical protein n=1 Tax=Granulosicoccus sp. 3-233 TaxID=3417969 RepID=UPI003D33879B